MKVGFPTHPRKNIKDEIQWIGENAFDFVDLFLEADQGEEKFIDPKEVRRVLGDYNLDLTGHTAWYLPIGSPIKELRKKAVEILKTYIRLFASLECRKVTVHANWPPGLFTIDEGIQFQTDSLSELVAFASQYSIKILYESLGTKNDSQENIKKILDSNPDLDFHGDIGHLNLWQKNPLNLLTVFKERLSHIHMHDNDGSSDLHLPIGVGTIDWDPLITHLKTFYDDTITLEIFSRDRDYVLLSQKKLREKWAQL